MKLGFAGLGRTGRRMAANCVRAGHQVTVWNRSPDPVDTSPKTYGAAAAADPGQLAAGCEAVITMFANDEAACEVYLGPRGFDTQSWRKAVGRDGYTESVSRSGVVECGDCSG